jgi:hypothetical protein
LPPLLLISKDIIIIIIIIIFITINDLIILIVLLNFLLKRLYLIETANLNLRHIFANGSLWRSYLHLDLLLIIGSSLEQTSHWHVIFQLLDNSNATFLLMSLKMLLFGESISTPFTIKFLLCIFDFMHLILMFSGLVCVQCSHGFALFGA